MDAWGHHMARRPAAGIEPVLRQPFADDVAIGHHADQPIVVANRNGPDIMRAGRKRSELPGRPHVGSIVRTIVAPTLAPCTIASRSTW